MPPPHFLGFVPMALTSGLLFGVLWGLAMWLFMWRTQGWVFSATAGIVAGTFFGLCLATYYRHSAAKLKLSTWDRYPAA